MNRIFYLGILSILVLAGCSEETEPVAEAAVNEEAAIPTYFDGYVLNPQVTDDRSLEKAGQSFRDLRGEIELKAVNTEIPAYEVGGVELTVHEAKILHFKPEYSMIDFFHSYTHETEFGMVKYFVEITNTTEEVLKFAPVALVETNAGETKTWEEDIYLEELNGEIQPGETKKGNIGFILEKPSKEPLKFTTSDVFSVSDKKLAEAQLIEIEF
ncbi:hypothetical protein [Planomicrobium sp. Y74]|uniref:hypothetical protein n=1 Tax=Planomicrobium sp. Y74 TaxID=2478977 RepID=UPI000EF443B0|nr:hypothetical protein [Planomicrobium sp. Y74]RLQ84900.1 hypothetical protein D9754_16665 [Planomicrobium sp. Y74]